jgi:phosphoglycerate-specific signal transduction histidine kinase
MKKTLKLFKKLKDKTIQLVLDNILETTIQQTIDNFINIYLVYKKIRPAYCTSTIKTEINVLREKLDMKLFTNIYYIDLISDELKTYISNYKTLSNEEYMTELGKILGYTYADSPGWNNVRNKDKIII